MKKKFLWLCILIYVVLFVASGLIIANTIATPIALTEKEISYYTEIAENMWYNGLQSVEKDDDIIINYDLDDKTVRVSSRDTQKERITVDFSNSESRVVINEPSVSYFGCFFFYGWISATVICAILFHVYAIIKIKRDHKLSKNSRE